MFEQNGRHAMNSLTSAAPYFNNNASLTKRAAQQMVEQVICRLKAHISMLVCVFEHLTFRILTAPVS